MLEPHLAATQACCRALDEVLVIHDKTELSFAGAQVRAGLTALGPRRQGFWVHAALAVSAEGLRAPLGLLSVMPFVRKAGPARRPKPPWRTRFRDPDKRSRRWPASVTAARTREGDSYEVLAAMATHGDRFVVRLHYDRRVVPDEAATAPARLRQALPRTDVRLEREVVLSPLRAGAQRTPLLTKHPPRNGRVATLRFAARHVVLQRPRPHRPTLPATLAVNVVYAWEVHPPVGEPPVERWLDSVAPAQGSESLSVGGLTFAPKRAYLCSSIGPVPWFRKERCGRPPEGPGLSGKSCHLCPRPGANLDRRTHPCIQYPTERKGHDFAVVRDRHDYKSIGSHCYAIAVATKRKTID